MPDPRYYANQIELYGCQGSNWYISGPHLNQEAGVSLNPKLSGAIDAPVKTLWLPGAFGQESQGFRWERRDMVFAVQTFAQDPETWMSVDSEWRDSFSYQAPSRFVYTTSAGVRWLDVLMLEEPKAYEGEAERGKSPFLVCDATIVMTVAAPLPFYVSESLVYEWELPSDGPDFGFVQIHITNDSDVPVFPRWTLTGNALWTLPDFSWGSEEYARGLQDSGRMVELPRLDRHEDVIADADPRKQTLVSANMSNPMGRWKGQDLLYPIAPGTDALIPVMVQDAPDGAALRLEIPRWYTRPWGRPKP